MSHDMNKKKIKSVRFGPNKIRHLHSMDELLKEHSEKKGNAVQGNHRSTPRCGAGGSAPKHGQIDSHDYKDPVLKLVKVIVLNIDSGKRVTASALVSLSSSKSNLLQALSMAYDIGIIDDDQFNILKLYVVIVDQIKYGIKNTAFALAELSDSQYHIKKALAMAYMDNTINNESINFTVLQLYVVIVTKIKYGIKAIASALNDLSPSEMPLSKALSMCCKTKIITKNDLQLIVLIFADLNKK